MMATKHVNEFYSAYLDGSLPEAVLLHVETHLQQCPDCSQELSEMRMLLTALSDLPPVTVPEGLVAAIQQQLPATTAPRRQKWLLPSFVASALAATALLLFVFMHNPVPNTVITSANKDNHAPQLVNKSAENNNITGEITGKANLPKATSHKNSTAKKTKPYHKNNNRPQIADANIIIGAKGKTYDKYYTEEIVTTNLFDDNNIATTASMKIEDDPAVTDSISEETLTINAADFSNNSEGSNGITLPHARSLNLPNSEYPSRFPKEPINGNTASNIIKPPPNMVSTKDYMPGTMAFEITASGGGAMSFPGTSTLCNGLPNINYLTPPLIIDQKNSSIALDTFSTATGYSQLSLRNTQSLTIGQLSVAISEQNSLATSDVYQINLQINGKPRPCLFIRYAYPDETGKSFALPENNKANIILPASPTGTALEFSLAGNLNVDRFYLLVPPSANNETPKTRESETGTMVGVLLQTSRERGLFILCPADFAELIVDKITGDKNTVALEQLAKDAGYRMEAQDNLLNITLDTGKK